MEKRIVCREVQRKNTNITIELQNLDRKTVQENRAYLRVIIECLAFTAQQNIAQRGHREDRTNIDKISDENRGNFLELLNMRCKDIPWLSAKLKSKLGEHQQWTSWDIQNELLDIMANLVLGRIVSDIGDSNYSVT